MRCDPTVFHELPTWSPAAINLWESRHPAQAEAVRLGKYHDDQQSIMVAEDEEALPVALPDARVSDARASASENTSYKDGLEQVLSVLYGLYVALFGGSVYALLTRPPNTYHLAASSAMFLLTTAFMGSILAQILGAPITTSSSAIIDPTTLVPCGAGTSERLHEARMFNLLGVIYGPIDTCMSLIADGILIYRCVVLWPQWLGCCVEMTLGMLLLAEAATGFAASYLLAEIYYLQRQLTTSSERTLTPRWIQISHYEDTLDTASDLLALAVNVLATILIASRIWYMARQSEVALGRATGVRYRAAVSMIIESGLLVTASQLAMACVALIDSVAIYNVIGPTLIIVRVSMGQGFDSVIETAHEHHASHGPRETQVRSIRFASHPTTTAEGSHLASVEANIRSTGPQLDTDSRSACNGHEHSDDREKAEDANEEKAETTSV
ncbi:hypothetical protein EVG20_g10738 [Dentipellis fragilis]|uniref:Uncharacterized protein n=1 Tax=Dentipellis fragilis TaxID=205917 RepID=A0A4Y9XS60_9AGAM|nr:hypothetical protein EVG20_g10738 [Dentipellis fragilis]